MVFFRALPEDYKDPILTNFLTSLAINYSLTISLQPLRFASKFPKLGHLNDKPPPILFDFNNQALVEIGITIYVIGKLKLGAKIFSQY